MYCLSFSSKDRAEVTPAVDFGRLEQVFVLLWRGPSIELLYRGDGDLAEGPTR